MTTQPNPEATAGQNGGEATPKQIRWWNRFSKTLREMPEDMEILVSAQGHVSAAKRGASNEYFREHGDVDNVQILYLPHINHKGIENNGSSL